MKGLLDCTPEELSAILKDWNQPAFRAKQVFRWCHQGRQIDEMTNLPLTLRTRLKKELPLGGVDILESVRSKIDDTVKCLFRLSDGNIIEGVLMRYHHGCTLCISTQVGCRMGCAFCASTLKGRVRNLTAGEMLGQILAVNRTLEAENEHISNVVMMGSGEPLDNYDEVVRFLKLLSHPDGIRIGLRHVSLSTCGLVPEMLRFAKEDLPVTLCLSLHAPDDGLRKQIMPIANKYPLEQVLSAVRTYVELTGRRAIFEYTLIRGVNDSSDQANALADRIRGLQCHVNLIPINAVKERNWEAPDKKRIAAFMDQLKRRGVSVTLRREMGDDIEGACGQLRRHYLKEQEERA